MLFNSLEFLLVFLPGTLLVYYRLLRAGRQTSAQHALVIASAVFYGYWNPPYLLLLGASIIANFAIARRMTRASDEVRLAWLITGVTLNLLVIGYYKYAAFTIDSLNSVLDLSLTPPEMLLPLAISFFTFQQIAFLVDVYKSKVSGTVSLPKYALFVMFFPQLIAGPIVHHKEMMPQFSRRQPRNCLHYNLAIGLSIFLVGLFKKVVLADQLAGYANPVFTAAEQQIQLTFLESWLGALAYTFQLYFDFSGYSDMAIGLGYMFGIKLPLNFFSPYKATSIIDFWRRWHITLSRFLRDYLYIPLGGGRRGVPRRYANLMITMLLGGLWHGAGWTFVLWGALHGGYLMANHAWREFAEVRLPSNVTRTRTYRFISWAITFNAIVFAWVLFRAESLGAAMQIWFAMIGGNGVALPEALATTPVIGALANLFATWGDPFANGFANWGDGLTLISLAAAISLLSPNVAQLFGYHRAYAAGSNRPSFAWRPTVLWGGMVTCCAVFAFARVFSGGNSEFLYFNF
jgi:D-alanyl-lipoteichoic acid acyltransferase DltB (MBOAT superfamily)